MIQTTHVDVDMRLQMPKLTEFLQLSEQRYQARQYLITDLALEGAITRMHVLMGLQVALLGKALVAVRTLEGSEGQKTVKRGLTFPENARGDVLRDFRFA